jgi:hypothetical protein
LVFKKILNKNYSFLEIILNFALIDEFIDDAIDEIISDGSVKSYLPYRHLVDTAFLNVLVGQQENINQLLFWRIVFKLVVCPN